MKYYTDERPDLGTLNQVFLDYIKTQKLFQKRKIWGRLVLKNFLNLSKRRKNQWRTV